MFKRLFWLAVGVGLGFGLSIWAAKAMKRTAERYTPESIAGRLADGLREMGRELRLAVQEGREAMAEREAELRGEVEGRAPMFRPPHPAMGQGADPARN